MNHLQQTPHRGWLALFATLTDWSGANLRSVKIYFHLYRFSDSEWVETFIILKTFWSVPMPYSVFWGRDIYFFSSVYLTYRAEDSVTSWFKTLFENNFHPLVVSEYTFQHLIYQEAVVLYAPNLVPGLSWVRALGILLFLLLIPLRVLSAVGSKHQTMAEFWLRLAEK